MMLPPSEWYERKCELMEIFLDYAIFQEYGSDEKYSYTNLREDAPPEAWEAYEEWKTLVDREIELEKQNPFSAYYQEELERKKKSKNKV